MFHDPGKSYNNLASLPTLKTNWWFRGQMPLNGITPDWRIDGVIRSWVKRLNQSKQGRRCWRRCNNMICNSDDHLLVITGYNWEYTFYKWGYS